MIKAGALLYAMFLIIVITIISSSFILVNYYNGAYVIHLVKKEQLLMDVNSGINYGLTFHKTIPLNQTLEVDLFEDGQHPVSIQKKAWGAFYVLTSSATSGKNSTVKSALIGSNFNEGEKTALYLTDQNKPLSLCGNTKIVGDSYLPEAGVKRAYIEGKSFAGSTLIEGTKFTSKKTLPEINQEIVSSNENYLSAINTTDSVVSYELVMEFDSITNPFSNKTLLVYSPTKIDLDNKVVQGNVIIKSDQQITLSSNTTISEAILYAKSVIIKKDFKGDVQVFAKDSIVVEENCVLSYPSVLALLCDESNQETNQKIVVREQTKLTGAIFLNKKTFNRNHQAIISISKEVMIQGQIYSSELLDFEGTIYGGVFCQKLLLKTPSSVYENHLLDAIIDRTKLSENFVGVPLTEETKHQRIIKWLN